MIWYPINLLKSTQCSECWTRLKAGTTAYAKWNDDEARATVRCEKCEERAKEKGND